MITIPNSLVQRVGALRPAVLIGIWLGVRIVVFGFWLLFVPSTQGDVTYYWDQVRRLGTNGHAATLTEYPTPVIWLLQVPLLLGGGSRLGYTVAFVLAMLALDAWFTWCLLRSGSRWANHAVLTWIIFLGLMGPTAYLRFDLVPAVLTGTALLALLRGRSLRSGLLLGTGAAVKLWPALMWPALVLGRPEGEITPANADVETATAHNSAHLRPDRGRSWLWCTIGVLGWGAVLALVSLAWAGWDRLLSPLTWQNGRGLQVESVWATGPMVARMFDLDAYWVGISSFQAFEVTGPGTGTISAIADVVTKLGYLAIVGVYGYWWLAGSRPVRRLRPLPQAGAMMIVVVLIIMVTNKTFSPQYMMWLAAPVCAAVVTIGRPPGHASGAPSENAALQAQHHIDRQGIAAMVACLIGLTALTGIIYPVGYGPLVQSDPGMRAITVVLALRNLLLVVMLVLAVVWMVRSVRATRGRTALADSTTTTTPAGASS